MNRNSNCNFAVATGHVPVIHNQSLVDDSNVLIQRTCWADMHRNREQDIARRTLLEDHLVGGEAAEVGLMMEQIEGDAHGPAP